MADERMRNGMNAMYHMQYFRSEWHQENGTTVTKTKYSN